MIQRIQTIYLALGILLSAILFTGIANYSSNGQEIKYGIFKIESTAYNVNTFIIGILAISTILLCAYGISQYKNRKLQMNICHVIFLLAVLQTLAHAYYHNQLLTYFNLSSDFKQVKLYIPIAVLILSRLALHAIKKDEDLVKSADRLR